MKRRMMALLLAGVMGVGMMSGCGSSKSADSGKVVREESDEPIDVLNQDEKMKLSIVCLQGYTQPDSEMQKWMEDRYNLDIDIIALPGWSDATSKISLLMGDETQRPDIIWWWNMEADYTKWVDAGLLVDVSPYMKKYTNMVDYYNSVDPGVMFYAFGDNGIYRIPGDGAVNTEQNLGINLIQDLFARKDAANIANTEETTELFEKVKENSRDAYAKTIEKKNPDAYTVNNDLGTDIGDAIKEYTWGVIGGGKSLDDWDSYVDKINGLGLQDVLDELKEIHGKQVEDYQKYLEEYNK